MTDLTILVGDVRDKLRELPAASVQCIISSPPYWALRDYGTGEWKGGDPKCRHESTPAGRGPSAGHGLTHKTINGNANYKPPSRKCAKCPAVRVNDSQIGSEPTVEEFYQTMVGVCRELRRVLRDDGTLWLNMGDCYAQDGGSDGSGEYEAARTRAADRGYDVGAWGAKDSQGSGARNRASGTARGLLKAKDLVGQAWGLAFALRDDGWYLRSCVIWSKPNGLPESVVDRPATSHEYVFLLTKQPTYFYDHLAVRQAYAPVSLGQEGYTGSSTKEYESSGAQNASDTKRRIAAAIKRNQDLRKTGNVPGKGDPHSAGTGSGGNLSAAYKGTDWDIVGRNLRTVWTIPTQAFKDSHFATFPERLVEPCIKAGTSEVGACRKCGAPWRRIAVASGGSIGSGWHDHSADATKGQSGQVGTIPSVKAAQRDRGRERGGSVIGGIGSIASRKSREAAEKTAARAILDRAGGLGAGNTPEWDSKAERYRVETVGWEPSCAHKNVKDPVPCVVLDPFGGSGTTASVARFLGRSAILIELNPKYAAMAEKRARARPTRLLSKRQEAPLDRAARVARELASDPGRGGLLARAVLEHLGELGERE